MLKITKLITFDVTNTLVLFKNSVGHEYCKVASAHKVPVNIQTEEKLKHSFKKQWKSWNEKHPNYGATTGLTSKQWWSALVNLTFRDAGFTNEMLSSEILANVADNLWVKYSGIDCWTLKTDAIETLKYIRNEYSYVKLGIISNSDERVLSILNDFGIRQYFDFVVVSAIVKCEKPNPDIFKFALHAAGIEDPKQALHIGDDVNKDYLAAKKYGWNALLLNEKRLLNLNRVENDHVVTSFKELIKHPLFKQFKTIDASNNST
ncbi:rhythmically expressed gene 2 protein-like protein [Leptotrombidium deliense]|uniref:Rhythmically expressed gene 2 protein-like protein n=1 Tax=Leptotrombidium deliense TaxID=299467 RepID=A0A443SMT4_9ACAR|nr:rhythmically expressed gene 2 protein-like protein [Leptotrombidium deliense]